MLKNRKPSLDSHFFKAPALSLESNAVNVTNILGLAARVVFWPDDDPIVIFDGPSSIVIGDSGFSGSANATLSGAS